MSYRVSGDLIDTTGPAIAAALADGAWKVRQKSSYEVFVDGAKSSFSIYSSTDTAERGSYLVSGEMDGPLDDARAELTMIGERLAAQGIVYHFELTSIGAPSDSQIIEHPEYS